MALEFFLKTNLSHYYMGISQIATSLKLNFIYFLVWSPSLNMESLPLKVLIKAADYFVKHPSPLLSAYIFGKSFYS